MSKDSAFMRAILLLAFIGLAVADSGSKKREIDGPVIGIDLDYETVGKNGGMLMVTASGTAVKL